MNYKVIINMPIFNYEVLELRELVGWGRRDKDYPKLFERCNFWAYGASVEWRRNSEIPPEEFIKLVIPCIMGLILKLKSNRYIS